MSVSAAPSSPITISTPVLFLFPSFLGGSSGLRAPWKCSRFPSLLVNAGAPPGSSRPPARAAAGVDHLPFRPGLLQGARWLQQSGRRIRDSPGEPGANRLPPTRSWLPVGFPLDGVPGFPHGIGIRILASPTPPLSLASLSTVCPTAQTESSPADVKYFDALLFFQDPIDLAIDIRFVAVQQVPQSIALGRHRTPVRISVEGKNG